MIILLTIVHVIVCLFLIIVVLLQSGKAADLAGAFGGMGSQTAFGPRGAATVLSKATTIAAVLFMVGSLSLSVLYTRTGRGAGSTVLETAPPPVTQQAPAQQKQQGPIKMTVETESGQVVSETEIPVPPPPGQKQAPAKK
jgi:preprotein translocase subunit SecG